MNIGKSFSFIFEDRQWISKLGLGALIAMIPILNFAWTGYIVGIIRNVMNDKAEPLPSWDDFGNKLMEGLLLSLAGFAYSLPILLVFCLPMSFMVVPGILSGNSDLQSISESIAGFGVALFFCLLCVFAGYMLVLSIIYPAILTLFAREGTFASCFKFREVFDLIGKNTSPFFTAWIISLGGGFFVGLFVGVAQTILNFIPCFGQIVSLILTLGIVVYTSTMYAHLFGQFGNIAFPKNPSLSVE